MCGDKESDGSFGADLTGWAAKAPGRRRASNQFPRTRLVEAGASDAAVIGGELTRL